MKALFVAPHPDDAEIALGGFINALTRRGDQATIAVCTGPGDLTMVHSGEVVSFEKRRQEQRSAATLLCAQAKFLDLAPASRFDTVSAAVFVSAFDALFPLFDRVYLPLPSYAADHAVVWKAGLAAFRPGKLDAVALYAYEQACANCLAETSPGLFGRQYLPITRQDLAAKIAAIACHQSQMAGRKSSLYGGEGVVSLAQLRGAEVGMQYAEMVHLVRAVSCN